MATTTNSDVTESKALLNEKKEIKVISPKNVEIEGKIEHIQLKRVNKIKRAFYIIGCILTGGLLYLLALWFIEFKIWLTLSDAELKDADMIIIFGSDNTIEVQPIEIQELKGQGTKVFIYRLFKYICNHQTMNFEPAEFKVDNLEYYKIYERYKEGLDEDAYEENLRVYGSNSTNIPMKSIPELLIDEVLSPFYIFQVFSIIIWCFDEYQVYSGIIGFLSAISIATTLYETRQTTLRLKKMAEFHSQVFVYRKKNLENKKKVDSATLVPGDIIEVPEGDIMPCDAILLNGTCIMNEAMLTGESIPVTKTALPISDKLYQSSEDKNCTLFAGTICIQAKFFKGRTVLALVTRTGFTTVKGELIRTMLFPKASNFKFYYDSFMFIGILAIMAVVGFLIDLPFFLNGDNSSTSILIIKCCEIITVTVPPALPTCMAVGINVAIISLLDHKIYCISPNKINEAGKVNVMCFDKTGTLTEEGLDMEGVRTIMYDKNINSLCFDKMVTDCKHLMNPPDNKDELLHDYIHLESTFKTKNKKSCFEATRSTPKEYMSEIMATCHSLTTVIDKSTQKEKLIGDPLDLKMYEACGWIMEENISQYDPLVIAALRPADQDKDSPNEINIIRRFEFSPKLQRMSVIVRKMEDNGFRMHVKGSPEKIRELCVPESIPSDFHNVLRKYTENGKRVLAVGTKMLPSNYDFVKIAAANQEELENDFIFIGFLIMENKLKPITSKIINDLHKAKIRTIMVTGDNILTAISVARQCHIVKPKQRIYLSEIIEPTNGEEKPHIVWRNFEYSDDELNTEDDEALDSQENNNMTIKGEKQENKEEIIPSSIAVMDLDFFQKTELDYVFAVSGKAFSLMLDEIEHEPEKYLKIFRIMLDKSAIFARMHPDEKALMIKHIQTYRRNIVGMCGDGANDCCALKTANVGMSLSEAEASIAAPFTSKQQDIACVVTLLRYGRAALTTSFQCFKYMALYSVIQSTTLTIVYAFQIDLSNFNYYYIDVMIILPLSFTMAFSDAYKKLSQYQPAGRLISFPILTSVIGQGLIQILCQVAVVIILFREPWYQANKCHQKMTSSEEPCIENCSLFLISIFQYVFVALAFMVGKPFRKPFYTNFWFSFCVILLTISNLFLLFDPFNWQWLYPAANGNPDDNPVTMLLSKTIKQFNFQYVLFTIVIINTILTLVWEKVVVIYGSLKWKDYKNARKKAEREKALKN